MSDGVSGSRRALSIFAWTAVVSTASPSAAGSALKLP
jgi:hypothetical protein